MIHNMEITSSGTHHKIVIDGQDISDKVSRCFIELDPDGLPAVNLICTPMKIAIKADDVKIVEHVMKLTEETDEQKADEE